MSRWLAEKTERNRQSVARLTKALPAKAVTACQEAVAKAMGCAPDAVKIHVTFLGGSFGRKIVPDYVVQAVQASNAVGRPVKLIRTREEDT